jgi:hypothetical protein
LEFAAKQLNITEPEDWYRISSSQITQTGGAHFFLPYYSQHSPILTRYLGWGMLQRFGSLYKTLEFAYPDYFWDEKKFTTRGKKSAQRWCFSTSALFLFLLGG